MTTFYLYHHITSGGKDVYRLSENKTWAGREWQGRTIISEIEAESIDKAEEIADYIIDAQEQEHDPDAPYFCDNCQQYHFDMCEAPRTPYYPEWYGQDEYATKQYALDMIADMRVMG